MTNCKQVADKTVVCDSKFILAFLKTGLAFVFYTMKLALRTFHLSVIFRRKLRHSDHTDTLFSVMCTPFSGQSSKYIRTLSNFGGDGEIRTPGTVSRTPPFQGGTLDRSATSPCVCYIRKTGYFPSSAWILC